MLHPKASQGLTGVRGQDEHHGVAALVAQDRDRVPGQCPALHLHRGRDDPGVLGRRAHGVRTGPVEPPPLRVQQAQREVPAPGGHRGPGDRSAVAR